MAKFDSASAALEHARSSANMNNQSYYIMLDPEGLRPFVVSHENPKGLRILEEVSPVIPKR